MCKKLGANRHLLILNFLHVLLLMEESECVILYPCYHLLVKGWPWPSPGGCSGMLVFILFMYELLYRWRYFGYLWAPKPIYYYDARHFSTMWDPFVGLACLWGVCMVFLFPPPQIPNLYFMSGTHKCSKYQIVCILVIHLPFIDCIVKCKPT